MKKYLIALAEIGITVLVSVILVATLKYFKVDDLGTGLIVGVIARSIYCSFEFEEDKDIVK